MLVHRQDVSVISALLTSSGIMDTPSPWGGGTVQDIQQMLRTVDSTKPIDGPPSEGLTIIMH